MLVWRKGNVNRTVFVFQQCILHSHNEQFFQVGLLDRALISFIPPSTSVSSDFMVLYKFFENYTYFTLPCTGLGLVLVGLALYMVD